MGMLKRPQAEYFTYTGDEYELNTTKGAYHEGFGRT